MGAAHLPADGPEGAGETVAFPGARVPASAGLARLAVAVRPVIAAAAVTEESWRA